MKVVYVYFLILLSIPSCLTGQVDSTTIPLTVIDSCRLQLLRSFEADNRLDTQFWLDSLQNLESEDYLALQWDERWLLYFWLENYTPLFAEVVRFEKGLLEAELYKIPPAPDSLFITLDQKLFETQGYLFDQIRKAWLTTEERAFATLLLDYLLRLSIEEPEATAFDNRISEFLKQFPNTRFKSFIKSRMYNTTPAGKWAFGFDALFLQGNWSGGLERSLKPMFGADLALNYWQSRWNGGIRLAFGGQKLARDVEQNGFLWEEDEASTYFNIELETGYDILNSSKLRIYPSIAGGFSSIHPPENEDNPNPDYFDNFRFNGWHWTAALQADLKFGLGKGNVATSYHGLRVRVGHRWLNLSKGNAGMKGNLIFVAVGYSLFSRQP